MEKPAHGSGLRLSKLFCRALEVVKWPATSSSKVFSATTASLLLVVLLVGTIASTRWIGVSTFAGVSFQRLFRPFPEYPLRDEYLLYCTTTNTTLTCLANYSPPGVSAKWLSHHQCPDYFRWIHEDLKPWKKEGITLKMVESAKQFTHFRLVIVNGTAYVKKYDTPFQPRDVLTLWGVLQLLKLYPG
ncbi:hypothetical protein Nepgr_024324 [Nepenthes gracilis]|uniref:Glycosyl transferase CAP10 domain-containing protein n=1 Tax=Nepenthes gracilis TaxID=150966 RepID=A0AAD3T4G9_NEPGR|nr:hypothetical protein Nepgr_024324 [Nepenthes gracilis]